MKDALLGRIDKDLLEAVRKCDPRAERALYNRHFRYSVKMAFRYLRDESQAEDIAQEALYAVYRHLQKGREITDLKAYLTAVIVNLCKKAIVKQPFHVSLDDKMISHLEEFDPVCIDSGVNTLDEISNRQLVNLAMEQLLVLSKTKQTALTLRYLAELPYADIAKVMGKTEGCIRAIIHRGVNSLREMVKVAE